MKNWCFMNRIMHVYMTSTSPKIGDFDFKTKIFSFLKQKLFNSCIMIILGQCKVRYYLVN